MRTRKRIFRGLLPALLLVGLAGFQAGCTETSAGTAVGGTTLAGGDKTGKWASRVRGRGPAARLCRGGMERRMERFSSVVEGLAKLDDTQTAAWNRLKTASASAIATVRKNCETLKTQGRPATGPERLQRLESVLAARLDALRAVRPAFTAFYETLDKGQQDALDTLRGSRWHHRRHRH